MDKHISTDAVRSLYKLHANVADFLQTGAFTNREIVHADDKVVFKL